MYIKLSIIKIFLNVTHPSPPPPKRLPWIWTSLQFKWVLNIQSICDYIQESKSRPLKFATWRRRVTNRRHDFRGTSGVFTKERGSWNRWVKIYPNFTDEEKYEPCSRRQRDNSLHVDFCLHHLRFMSSYRQISSEAQNTASKQCERFVPTVTPISSRLKLALNFQMRLWVFPKVLDRLSKNKAIVEEIPTTFLQSDLILDGRNSGVLDPAFHRPPPFVMIKVMAKNERRLGTRLGLIHACPLAIRPLEDLHPAALGRPFHE